MISWEKLNFQIVINHAVFLKIEVTLCFSLFWYERYLAALRFEEP